MGVDLDGLDRGRVAAVDDPAARPVRPHDLLGSDAVDGLAALQAAEVRPFGDAQPARRRDVEAARPVVLDERVAVGLDPVLDRERRDLEAVEADLGVRLELLDRAAGRACGPSSAAASRKSAPARAGRRASAARSRARRSNVLSIPISPSQWSRCRCEMKIASRSGSPIERSSCCWVPSPQSNRIRWPPARSSSAGRPRRGSGRSRRCRRRRARGPSAGGHGAMSASVALYPPRDSSSSPSRCSCARPLSVHRSRKKAQPGSSGSSDFVIASTR